MNVVFPRQANICAPSDRIALPQKLVNDMRADKARCTGNLKGLSDHSRRKTNKSVVTYKDERHADREDRRLSVLSECVCHAYLYVI
jgi:hypothetical protein